MSFQIPPVWDIFWFWQYADKFVKGFVPYKDFFFEYPPLSIYLFTLPRYFTDNPKLYARIFNLLALISAALIVLLLKREKKNFFIFLTGIGLLFPFVIQQFDIFASLLVFLAVYFINKKRALFGWFSLSIATLLKLYPLVLAPLFLIKNKSLKGLFLFLLIVTVGFGYPYHYYKEGFKEFLDFQKQRTPQIESGYMLYLYPKSLREKKPISLRYNEKFFEIEFENEEEDINWAKKTNSILLLLIVLSYIPVLFRRKENIFRLAYIPILAFILGNKAFSPQYLLWLLPFVPFLHVAEQALLILSFFLTAWYYGFALQLSQELKVEKWQLKETPTILLLYLRNLLLVLTYLKSFLVFRIKDIKYILTQNMTRGFYLKRRDFFLGKWLKFGESGRIKLLRLARKNAGKWTRPVHETWQIRGKTKTLSSPLLHFPAPDVAQFLEKLNYYTTLNAQFLYNKQGVKSSCWQILLYPTAKFFKNYFLKFGFLDGTSGFLHAVFMSFHSFLTRAKLWLLQKKISTDKSVENSAAKKAGKSYGTHLNQ